MTRPKQPPARVYRMRNGTRVWHFCSNCSEWPESEFTEAEMQPVTGLFCGECLSHGKHGTCTFAGRSDASA